MGRRTPKEEIKTMTKAEAIEVLTGLANGTPAEGVLFSVREAAKVAIEVLSAPELTAELEEEVIKFWNDNALAYRAGHIADLTFLRFAAQHFSKWQKEQDEKDLTDKIAAAYQLGLTNRQVNTREEVVDGFIFQSEEYYPKEVIGRYDGELKNGDKVKLIIIKVDEGI